MASILTKDEIQLLARTRELLEEILESVEISRDPKIVKAIREAVKDVKSGRTRLYKDFIKEHRSSHAL